FTTFSEATRCKIRVKEIDVVPGIGVVKEVAVGPLKIESIIERLTEFNIVTRGSAQVHKESLHTARAVVANALLFQKAILCRRDVIAGMPGLCDTLRTKIQVTRLQCFNCNGVITVVIDNDLIKVVMPNVNCKIFRPVVGDSFIDRKSTRLNSSHVKISYAVFCLKKKSM